MRASRFSLTRSYSSGMSSPPSLEMGKEEPSNSSSPMPLPFSPSQTALSSHTPHPAASREGASLHRMARSPSPERPSRNAQDILEEPLQPLEHSSQCLTVRPTLLGHLRVLDRKKGDMNFHTDERTTENQLLNGGGGAMWIELKFSNSLLSACLFESCLAPPFRVGTILWPYGCAGPDFFRMVICMIACARFTANDVVGHNCFQCEFNNQGKAVVVEGANSCSNREETCILVNPKTAPLSNGQHDSISWTPFCVGDVIHTNQLYYERNRIRPKHGHNNHSQHIRLCLPNTSLLVDSPPLHLKWLLPPSIVLFQVVRLCRCCSDSDLRLGNSNHPHRRTSSEKPLVLITYCTLSSPQSLSATSLYLQLSHFAIRLKFIYCPPF
ncbi:hypothetical protein BLNAU_20669 [Blattamonas nauphoetae]|uniref:Uncharacterized protein n=1 Tax=Blattamonas nauphoetae TaxID=2049346 RepID=A0ABQ9WY22_9EUKA|nr:hypothetical protein BLNAU_20669 [Blattamonas nauphoetae]